MLYEYKGRLVRSIAGSKGTTLGLKRWWIKRRQKEMDRCPVCKPKNGSTVMHFRNHDHLDIGKMRQWVDRLAREQGLA